MRVRYKGPREFINVGLGDVGSVKHFKGEIEQYPDDIGKELLKSRKNKFEEVKEDKKPDNKPSQKTDEKKEEEQKSQDHPQGESEGTKEVDLEKMNVTELREMASKIPEIKGEHSMKKEELIKAIKKFQKGDKK